MNSEVISAAITFVFLLIVISYYVLMLIRPKKYQKEKTYTSLSVIIPAHNEEAYIKRCIQCVLGSEFPGKMEVIVVDDGSTDRTYQIISQFKKKVKIIRKAHTGKSDSINSALKISRGEVVAVVDGDSFVQKSAFSWIVKEIEKKGYAAATGVVKAANRNRFACMWLHIDLIFNSLMRKLMSNVNANIVTPGPLSAYRKKELLEAGGFSTGGYSEDVDVTIKLIRKGYRIGFSESAVSETNMPYDFKGFFRQQRRFARGTIDILKKYLRVNGLLIDIYALPLLLFRYIQAVIMGSLIIYQIISGYVMYFANNGVYFNIDAARYFFEWFSLIGFVKWVASIITGVSPLTFLSGVTILSSLLSYPLYFYAILRYDKTIDLRHIIPIIFMFPYWLIIMVVYIFTLPTVFGKESKNIWKKNE